MIVLLKAGVLMQRFSAWPRACRRQLYWGPRQSIALPAAAPGMRAGCKLPGSTFGISTAIRQAPGASASLSTARLAEAARAPCKPPAGHRLLFQNEAPLAAFRRLPLRAVRVFTSEITSKLILSTGREIT